ncbi:unnamed protein product [Owenia fusiformis]|uniref:Uncharacterized protein n=1 Tax=Owenia fusiformis TaxID=6347 RepID=A0A8S4PWK2_OWEFU|nr:unnamed protein product [Owenia fusiformis]
MSNKVFILLIFIYANVLPCYFGQNDPCTYNVEDATAWCDGKNLTAVPSNLPNTTRTLHLENNIMTKINNGSFRHLPLLKNLYMMNNSIDKLIQPAWKGLMNLETLNLSGNSFRKLGTYWFTLPIQNLIIDENKALSEMEMNTFTSQMQSLSIRFCNISQLNKEIFWTTSRIGTIDFSGNPLHHIESGTFKYINGLENIIIDQCDLTIVKDEFKTIDTVKKIHLVNNKITYIIATAFEGNIELNEVNLFGNELSLLPDAFLTATSIRNINVSKNSITKFTQSDSRIFIRLARFDGSENPFECTEELWYFIHFAISPKGVSVVQNWPNGYRCALPIEHSGKTLLEYSNFTQAETTTEYITIQETSESTDAWQTTLHTEPPTKRTDTAVTHATVEITGWTDAGSTDILVSGRPEATTQEEVGPTLGHEGETLNTAMIVGITVGVLMLILLVILCIYVIKKKKKEKIESSNNNSTAYIQPNLQTGSEMSLKQTNQLDSHSDLQNYPPRNNHKKPEGPLFKNYKQIKSHEVTPRAGMIEKRKANQDDVDTTSEALPRNKPHEENFNPVMMVRPVRHNNEFNIPNLDTPARRANALAPLVPLDAQKKPPKRKKKKKRQKRTQELDSMIHVDEVEENGEFKLKTIQPQIH